MCIPPRAVNLATVAASAAWLASFDCVCVPVRGGVLVWRYRADAHEVIDCPFRITAAAFSCACFLQPRVAFGGGGGLLFALSAAQQGG